MKKPFCSRIVKLQSISFCNNFRGEMWKEIRQRNYILGLLVMLEFPDFLLVYQVSWKAAMSPGFSSFNSCYICCVVLQLCWL